MSEQEAVDKVVDKALEYLAKVENLAVEVAPKAWEATLSAIQVQGIVEISLGAVLFLIGIIGCFVAIKIVMKYNNGDEAAAVPVFGVSVIPLIVGTLKVFNSDNWIAAISPAATLILKIIN